MSQEEMVDLIRPRTHCSWYKVVLFNRLLQTLQGEKFKYLVWIDADACVVNPNVTIEALIELGGGKDLIIAEDMTPSHQINAGVMIIKRSAWSAQLFKDIWDSVGYNYCQKWGGKAAYEQSAMCFYLRAQGEGLENFGPPFHSYEGGQPIKRTAHVCVLPSRVLNSNKGWSNSKATPSQLQLQLCSTAVPFDVGRLTDRAFVECGAPQVDPTFIFHAVGCSPKLGAMIEMVRSHEQAAITKRAVVAVAEDDEADEAAEVRNDTLGDAVMYPLCDATSVHSARPLQHALYGPGGEVLGFGGENRQQQQQQQRGGTPTPSLSAGLLRALELVNPRYVLGRRVEDQDLHNLVDRMLAAIGGNAGGGEGGGGSGEGGGGLDDDAITISSVDLRSNRITAVGVEYLAQLLTQAPIDAKSACVLPPPNKVESKVVEVDTAAVTLCAAAKGESVSDAQARMKDRILQQQQARMKERILQQRRGHAAHDKQPPQRDEQQLMARCCGDEKIRGGGRVHRGEGGVLSVGVRSLYLGWNRLTHFMPTRATDQAEEKGGEGARVGRKEMPVDSHCRESSARMLRGRDQSHQDSTSDTTAGGSSICIGFGALANALRMNRTLTFLELCSTGLNDVDAIALAAGMGPNRTLTALDLSNNLIGDEGMTSVADAMAQRLPLLSPTLILQHQQQQKHQLRQLPSQPPQPPPPPQQAQAHAQAEEGPSSFCLDVSGNAGIGDEGGKSLLRVLHVLAERAKAERDGGGYEQEAADADQVSVRRLWQLRLHVAKTGIGNATLRAMREFDEGLIGQWKPKMW
jgi:hypothetical protein